MVSDTDGGFVKNNIHIKSYLVFAQLFILSNFLGNNKFF